MECTPGPSFLEGAMKHLYKFEMEVEVSPDSTRVSFLNPFVPGQVVGGTGETAPAAFRFAWERALQECVKKNSKAEEVWS